MSARTASRVSGISSGSVTGQLASPIDVAVSSTTLVASPARSRASRSSFRVPSASTTALSSADDESGGMGNTGPAKNRPGIFALRVRHRRVAGGNARYRGVAPAPFGELRNVLVVQVIPDGLGDDLVQVVDVFDLAQRHAISGRPRSH